MNNGRLLEAEILYDFFKENPKGYVSLILDDCVFDITPKIKYVIDSNSISLWNTDYTKTEYGMIKVRRGDFVIPFDSIRRVEYITSTEVKR